MTLDEFWNVNQAIPRPDAYKALEERLNALEPTEIESFQRHFYDAFNRAYRWDLWGAAYLIDGGCSDDGFTDFRYGLISRGQTLFEAALADPDSLAVWADDGSEEGYVPDEDYGYVAYRVYEGKTGDSMPEFDVGWPSDPAGEDWDFDDADENAKRLPRLWAKFGW